MKQSEYIHRVTERVMTRLTEINRCSVPIGVSNRHVHVSKEAYQVLFGQDNLTKKVDLKQPGQYAANETVTLIGPKGSIEKVRILGPFREETQVEISLTDSFVLGVPGVIRESGDLKGTPGITLMGQKVWSQFLKASLLLIDIFICTQVMRVEWVYLIRNEYQ